MSNRNKIAIWMDIMVSSKCRLRSEAVLNCVAECVHPEQCEFANMKRDNGANQSNRTRSFLVYGQGSAKSDKS